MSHHGDSTPGSRRQTASEPQHEPPSPQQASPARSRGTNPFAAEVEEAEGEEADDAWNDADGWWNDDQWNQAGWNEWYEVGGVATRATVPMDMSQRTTSGPIWRRMRSRWFPARFSAGCC